MAGTKVLVALTAIFALVLIAEIEAGIIKDIFQKITHTNNKTEDVVKQSAPICGSGIFSTADQSTISPEIIFITSRPSRIEKVVGGGRGRGGQSNQEHRAQTTDKAKPENVNEVAYEFRFNVENVTLEELERQGFNRDAPVSWLMHGFTSGYPLQAWISAIVEAYTIDRDTVNQKGRHQQSGQHNETPQNVNYNQDGYQYHSNYNNYSNYNKREANRENSEYTREQDRRRDRDPRRESSNSKKVNHNLFIINWHHAARGLLLYPRAVANIPIVASYVTRFINEKLLGEAQVDPRRIQLIGHSLGAHLAGFIGKNTKQKIGRIYGLDPAGPCFGSVSGPLFPSSNRLAPTDAEEVITIQTNSALLGIDKPLGKHSVFVEGGAHQPGCKVGGALKGLSTLTMDEAALDYVSCSHSRAPNLVTYRYDQSDSKDDCQLVAYECKDWESFTKGFCGVCESLAESHPHSSQRGLGNVDPFKPVECLRVGLDWQYPKVQTSSNSHQSGHNSQQSNNNHGYSSTTSRYDEEEGGIYGAFSTTSRYNQNPSNSRNESLYGYSSTTRGYGRENENNPYGYSSTTRGYGRENENNPYGYSSTTRGYGRENENNPYGYSSTTRGYGRENENNPYGYSSSTSRRPHSQNGYGYQQLSSYDRNNYNNNRTTSSSNHEYNNDSQGSSWNRRPNSNQRERREARNQTTDSDKDKESTTRRRDDSSSAAKSMFLRTGDTQPYCVYQYQIILELNEPFPKSSKPPMSLVLQDSEAEREPKKGTSDSLPRNKRGAEQNSLSDDEFGNKYNDKLYTKLLTSGKKVKKVDHATLLFRSGLQDGHRILKSIHVNYMSHIDPNVRKQFSSRLCLVRTEVDRDKERDEKNFGGNRFYFEPCEKTISSHGSQQGSQYGSEHGSNESQYGSQHGPQQGSQYGSEHGSNESQYGSQHGSQQGSQYGSEHGSNESQYGSQHGPQHESQYGSQSNHGHENNYSGRRTTRRPDYYNNQ